MKSIYKRIILSTQKALPKSAGTIWWLLKIIIPISLAVSLMHYFGMIAWMAQYLTPVFTIIGLPGESAIVFITSIFLSLYAPIAIMATLPMDMREITIMALMCLISHNMFVESSIQKKTGSSYPVMFLLRLAVSFLAAYILNLVLPQQMGNSQEIETAVKHSNLTAMLWDWLKDAGALTLKITLIVTGLMILQNILKEFKIMQFLSKTFAPVMHVFGLSKNSSFLWFIAQITGLTYGSAILIEQTANKEITPEEADLLNYHIAINHSLLEDTLLFVAIGVPVMWITFPRIFLAILVVWFVKYLTSVRKRKKFTQNLPI